MFGRATIRLGIGPHSILHFVATSFLLVDGYAYSRSFCGGGLDVVTVESVSVSFSSVNKMLL